MSHGLLKYSSENGSNTNFDVVIHSPSRPRRVPVCWSQVADGDGLARALTNGFSYLLLVLRWALVLQHVQIVLVVEVEHLRDEAHAYPVALTQAEVDFDFLGHSRTFTGTCFQPITFCIWTRLQLSKST